MLTLYNFFLAQQSPEICFLFPVVVVVVVVVVAVFLLFFVLFCFTGGGGSGGEGAFDRSLLE